MKTWVVPGAPLAAGGGWRFWFSRADGDTAEPIVEAIVQVGQNAAPAYTTRWEPKTIAGLKRSFGVLEIGVHAPPEGATYRIRFPEARDDTVAPARDGWFECRSLPSQLPAGGLTFLVASCFWRDDDQYGGGYSAVVQDIVKKQKPAFKMLIGDQVYQDWPTPDLDRGTPLQISAARYEEYWGAPGYQDVLRCSPNFFIGDDHEFWNDYPEYQIHLPQTHNLALRQAHGAAALTLYRAYQQCANPGGAAWYSFGIAPVSFFVADSRSERSEVNQKPAPQLFSAPQWAALTNWITELRGPGVLVIGQPVYQDDGDFRDHSLSNFGADYDRLGRLLTASHEGKNQHRQPHQILVISGDIHCGRIARGRVASAPGYAQDLWEFITSPVSRISPYLKTPSPEKPRAKLRGMDAVGGHRIDVALVEDPPNGLGPGSRATIHNNIASITMKPAGDQVLFELGLRCIRPYSHVHWWEAIVDEKSFPAPHTELLRKEIKLR
jgi:hypothetical protein